MIEQLLQKLAELPPIVIYIVIGLGAAIENFIPPIPADTFVLLGAFLAAGGTGNAWTVFFVTWLANITSAALVYFIAYHYGKSFFDKPIGHMLINPHQMKQIGTFYDKWGVPAIFMSRFFPAFRAMVPVFAGVTHVPFFKVFIPVAAASALWYGVVVYIGTTAGKNWDELMAFFNKFSTILLVIAAVLLVAFGVWWWRSRKHKHV
jgi:membrane protein DedA with SNARE-associated domain